MFLRRRGAGLKPLLRCLCFLIRLLQLHFLSMSKKYIPITISAAVALITYFANFAVEDKVRHTSIEPRTAIALVVLVGIANTAAWGVLTYQAVGLALDKTPRKK